ncbi:unnamed protein product [Notodromas monacha]|uniref:Uncharacterized protein n=1 Tax=Notodromas monacha TaxID=399045 RepID=A0A7R9BC97_9CRUS|nr:unnamed protein product [Notodromas monacha]CAG0912579.1 unnamed protein product [Notodromas monacha]
MCEFQNDWLGGNVNASSDSGKEDDASQSLACEICFPAVEAERLVSGFPGLSPPQLAAALCFRYLIPSPGMHPTKFIYPREDELGSRTRSYAALVAGFVAEIAFGVRDEFKVLRVSVSPPRDKPRPPRSPEPPPKKVKQEVDHRDSDGEKSDLDLVVDDNNEDSVSPAVHNGPVSPRENGLDKLGSIKKENASGGGAVSPRSRTSSAGSASAPPPQSKPLGKDGSTDISKPSTPNKPLTPTTTSAPGVPSSGKPAKPPGISE